MTLIYIFRLMFCCFLLAWLEREWKGVKVIAFSSPPISFNWSACWGLWLPFSYASLLEKHSSRMEIIRLHVSLVIPSFPPRHHQNQSSYSNDRHLTVKGVPSTYAFLSLEVEKRQSIYQRLGLFCVKLMGFLSHSHPNVILLIITITRYSVSFLKNCVLATESNNLFWTW